MLSSPEQRRSPLAVAQDTFPDSDDSLDISPSDFVTKKDSLREIPVDGEGDEGSNEPRLIAVRLCRCFLR